MKLTKKQLTEEFGAHWIIRKIDVFAASEHGRTTWTFNLRNVKHQGMVIYLNEIQGGAVFIEEVYERLLDIHEEMENVQMQGRIRQ